MGLFQWFAKIKAERAERKRAEIARQLNARYENDLFAWRHEAQQLQNELDIALDPKRFTLAATELPLILHKGEEPLLVAQGAALVEPKRLPGQWMGGYSGFSFRIIKGVSYHVGDSRGTYVPGPEVPTPIATGTVTITNQRIVFQSDKQAREFLFAKLLGYQHDPAVPVTYFQVSNKQKVSGIAYDLETSRTVRFRLSLALAEFRGETASLVQELQAEIAKHDRAKPVSPQQLASGSAGQLVT
jgi:hypothetical protein